MATAHHVQIPPAKQVIYEADHPHWAKAFDSAIRSQQLAEDDQAWKGVTGILLTIVTIGVILAVITVSFCLWH